MTRRLGLEWVSGFLHWKTRGLESLGMKVAIVTQLSWGVMALVLSFSLALALVQAPLQQVYDALSVVWGEMGFGRLS